MAALNEREGEDLMNLVCGELLGQGQFRKVFRTKFDPNVVMKYEAQNKERCNIFEFDIWSAYKDHQLGKWLAPCYDLSPDGTWLTQAFCEDLQKAQLPDKISAFFCDLKLENFGLYEGWVVCRDYGFSHLYQMAHRSGRRLVNANWRI